MAMPLENKAGKLATFATVSVPPPFFAVPTPALKSNNH